MHTETKCSSCEGRGFTIGPRQEKFKFRGGFIGQGPTNIPPRSNPIIEACRNYNAPHPEQFWCFGCGCWRPSHEARSKWQVVGGTEVGYCAAHRDSIKS